MSVSDACCNDRHRLCRLVSGPALPIWHHVTCVDKEASKIAALKRGEIPIFEPGLDRIRRDQLREGRLVIHDRARGPVGEADAVFIAVGTPSRRGDGHADLSYVYAAAREIARALTGFTVVVTKSTVPVGTGDEVERIIRAGEPDGRYRRRIEPGVSARRRGHPRLQASGPHRHRHRG